MFVGANDSTRAPFGEVSGTLKCAFLLIIVLIKTTQCQLVFLGGAKYTFWTISGKGHSGRSNTAAASPEDKLRPLPGCVISPKTTDADMDAN